jgi:hypothetical protein
MGSADRIDQTSGLFPQKILERLFLRDVVRSRRYPSPLSAFSFAIRYPIDASADVVESPKLVMANLLDYKLWEVDLPGHYDGNYLVDPARRQRAGRQGVCRTIVDCVSRIADHPYGGIV